jgi:hypothetical protein
VSSLLRKLQVNDRRALAAAASTLGPAESAPPAVALPLPSPLTSFVGRAAERAALAAALETHRLVTAVGPGGVGKTRPSCWPGCPNEPARRASAGSPPRSRPTTRP